MELYNRLQLALQTDLGIVFLALAGLLIALVVLYGFLLFLQNQRGVISSRERTYYDKIDAMPKPFTYASGHRGEFWGRQSLVKFQDGKLGICLIPPSYLATDLSLANFQAFHRAIENRQLPLLAPYLWTKEDDALVVVQGGLLKSDGRPLLQLTYHLTDNRLSQNSKEEFLLNILATVRSLQGLETRTRKILYHGFLLPRSIFLETNPDNSINKVIIADAGLPFALGSQQVYRRFSELQNGQFAVDKFSAIELLEQWKMLSPEQREESRLNQVGPASDFYAFGALAAFVFSQKSFKGYQHIDWNLIPQNWHGFIKACLSDSPSDRPTLEQAEMFASSVSLIVI